MSKDPSAPKPKKATDDEVSDEVLKWISGGASKDAHGCPGCPHSTLGPAYQTGGHILVDGSIYQDGVFTRKL
jgi:hypothetical protein